MLIFSHNTDKMATLKKESKIVNFDLQYLENGKT